MRRLIQELRDMGGLLAKNPAMLFVALLVAGLAVSEGVQNCWRNDVVLTGNLRMSRVLRFSRANTIWRGDRVDRAVLRNLAFPPRPAKKAKAPAKPTAPRPNVASSAPSPGGCAGVSDLRFPEFNLLIPLL
jgi:hypothetical protein